VGAFCHPTPFHLQHFEDFLADPNFDQREAIARLDERFQREGIRDRFVDGIAAHPLSPEEYGFAIPGLRLKSTNVARFEKFCAFVRSLSDGNQVLLLKNPSDLGNVDFIRERYADAKFVFVHRHPGPTITSRLRELKALFFEYSPYQTVIQPAYGRIMKGSSCSENLRRPFRASSPASRLCRPTPDAR
jgi:hypothetical protein